ncbi:MAG TPA: hypothetical protein VK425_08395, partial [Acidimicrobiales bacterium]|nr:hypothetical protein [Acidimicrobiales bacterium]
LLNTVANSAAVSYLASHHGPIAAVSAPVHGYITGFVVSATVLAIAVFVSLGLISASRRDLAPVEALAPIG